MTSFKMRCELCGKTCESGYVLDSHMRHDHDGIGHQHKYTVPVETEKREVTVVDVNHVVNYTGRYKTVVTRLRCESCPDEISREDK